MKYTRLAAGVAATALTVVGAGVAPAGASRGHERPARLYEVTVEVTNLAPETGTFQTPVWLAVHDGSFDLYDRGAPTSAELERLAEDGNIDPLSTAFAASGAGVDGIAFGPEGPLAPGESSSISFTVNAERGNEQFLSYASMVIPSNDAFIANGDPAAHRIIDRHGRFRPASFVVDGSQVLDAGSEVNDEVPANTAFFGQATPDTGVVEGGVIDSHPGFAPVGSGGILAAEQFTGADFTADGYQMLSVEVSAQRIPSRAFARLSGGNEVPAVETRAAGFTRLRLQADGDIAWQISAARIDDVLAAHIHIGGPDENGPVAATLFTGDPTSRNRLRASGELSADDLTGPFEGMTTLELWQEIQAGNAYINIHSEDFPNGELRANLP